jgi:hypothetical protein
MTQHTNALLGSRSSSGARAPERSTNMGRAASGPFCSFTSPAGFCPPPPNRSPPPQTLCLFASARAAPVRHEPEHAAPVCVCLRVLPQLWTAAMGDGGRRATTTTTTCRGRCGQHWVLISDPPTTHRRGHQPRKSAGHGWRRLEPSTACLYRNVLAARETAAGPTNCRPRLRIKNAHLVALPIVSNCAHYQAVRSVCCARHRTAFISRGCSQAVPIGAAYINGESSSCVPRP